MASDEQLTVPKPAGSAVSWEVLRSFVEGLGRTVAEVGLEAAARPVDKLLEGALANCKGLPEDDRVRMEARLRVLADLAMQGWELRVSTDQIKLGSPERDVSDPLVEKQRIRRQEQLKRDEQLSSPAVRRFVTDMERRRLHGETFVSIFSLFRDGRQLSEQLREVRDSSPEERTDLLASVIDPYLVFFDEKDTCPHTGLRLMDVWRYFRHTWANQYTSIPGRTMMFLVRDRAGEAHPVIGIGALSSPIVQIRERDTWIGWHPETFLHDLQECPSARMGTWLRGVVNQALEELYVQDFLEGPGGEDLLTAAEFQSPDPAVIERLREFSKDQRKRHEQFADQAEYKAKLANTSQDTEGGPTLPFDPSGAIAGSDKRGVSLLDVTRGHLFASKRALALSDLLEARVTLDRFLGQRPKKKEVEALAADRKGRRAILKIVRKAKGDRVGIAMADISVCGAVSPYGPLLGGKLVSMLTASPEVVRAYRERYGEADSDIASKMAGRPIRRPAELVFLGTTSLYGRSAQYNRIRIPAEHLDGPPGTDLRFVHLGSSIGVGTSHYRAETIDALDTVVKKDREARSLPGKRINYIFGEGTSPLMRKLREGLTTAGFPADLVKHHRRRDVFGVPLIANLRSYLLGLEKRPKYICKLKGGEATAAITSWWRERWLLRRIESDDVLRAVEEHTLTWPIRHGARVQLPEEESDQPSFFEDI
jgi:hypothetical protein